MSQNFVKLVRMIPISTEHLNGKEVENNYGAAQEMFGSLGIDTEEAIRFTNQVRVSSPCWCLDNVTGYEVPNHNATSKGSASGLQAATKTPGMPRNLVEHRADLKKALDMVPGPNDVLVHDIYADTGGKYTPRNEHEPAHFAGWVQWAEDNGFHLHMNPSPFNHPMVKDGFTLASPEKAVRDYWIQEITRTRRIAEYMGKEQGATCVHNIWIPDGAMDNRIDRFTPREILRGSLLGCLAEEHEHVGDAVEGKLFGIGIEDYTVGHHQFYSDFSAEHGTILCFDTGHFTHMNLNELRDYISCALVSDGREGILMHVSYPRHWDSDFVPRTSDWLNAIADEIKRSEESKCALYWANDFFQPNAQPIAALVIGGRTTRKAILNSYLDPYDLLTKAEKTDDTNMAKLAIAERRKELPFGAVWDMYCLRHNVPTGLSFLREVARYETEVMSKRT